MVVRQAGRQRTADHRSDDGIGRRHRRLQRADVRAIAIDRDAIGDGKDLGHPMRHVQNRHAFRAQLPNELEEATRLMIGE